MKSPEIHEAEEGALWFKTPVKKGQRKAVYLRLSATLIWGKKIDLPG